MNRFLFDTATTLNGWIADEQNSLDRRAGTAGRGSTAPASAAGV